jgi:hypothetical protein
MAMKRFIAVSLTTIGIALSVGNHAASAASLFICDVESCANGVSSPDPYVTFTQSGFTSFQINSVNAGPQVVVSENAGPPPPSSVGGSYENDFAATWNITNPILPQNETVFLYEGPVSSGIISDVLHYTYSQDRNGIGHLDGFVMSDSSLDEAGINATLLALAGIFPTLSIQEPDGPFDFSNTNITAQFQSETPLPATWTMMLGGLALVGFAAHRRKKKGAAAFAVA